MLLVGASHVNAATLRKKAPARFRAPLIFFSAMLAMLAGAGAALLASMAAIRIATGVPLNQPYTPPLSHMLMAMAGLTAALTVGAFGGGVIWAAGVSRFAAPEEVGAAIRRYTRKNDRLLIALVRYFRRSGRNPV
jgi:hypothetical protein